MRNSNKGLAPIAIIIGVVVILAAASGGYWWWRNKVRIDEPVLNQQSFSTVDFCGTKYETQILTLEGTDVVGIISSLANTEKGTICSNIKLNIKSTDAIGVAPKKEKLGNTYLIALYRLNDIEQAKDPFNQSVLVFKFDFETNQAYFQQQFDGNFKEIGVIKSDADTSNWKTYTNSQYGFSFRYPNQVTVSEKQGVATIQDTKSNFSSQVRTVKGIKTFHWSRVAEDYYFDKNNVVRDRINGDKQFDPAFTVSGNPVYAFTTGDAGYSFVEYGVVNFERDEIVLFGLSSDGNSPEPVLAQFGVFEPIVKKIVGTVSFNMQSFEAANWKTYTDGQYGFSFKYPPSFALSVGTDNVIRLLGQLTYGEGHIWVKKVPDTQITTKSGKFGSITYYYQNGILMTDGFPSQRDGSKITGAVKLGSYTNGGFPIVGGTEGWHNSIIVLPHGFLSISDGGDVDPKITTTLVKSVR